ncbi:MAG TPA: TIGR02281 family clan AA aspartic protease [Xanthobacteraceae bacterium]|jgi:aspartyl protease family protein
MRPLIVFAALAMAGGMVIPRYASQIGAMTASRPTPAPSQTSVPAGSVPAGNVSSYARSVVVPRDARGHFQVDARVDGRSLNFMVDTGASVIALTASDAARLGIRPSSSEFVAEVRTANGTVRAAPTRLDAIEVGDLVVRDVAALVLPDEALSDNLLGLSFLSRLRRFEYSDGKLVLEQ